MMKFSNMNYVPIQCDQKVNISDMDSLHIDAYLAVQYAEVKLSLYSFGYTSNGVTVPAVSVPMPNKLSVGNGYSLGTWISIDIPIQYFKDNGQDCKGINLLRFDGKTEVYIDNIYAFKGAPSAVNVVNDHQSLKFYPTMVTDNLNFESSENLKKICLYNTMGQLVAVYSVNSEKSTINMSTLKIGIILGNELENELENSDFSNFFQDFKEDRSRYSFWKTIL